MRAYKRYSSRGFTLVELMIVVAIIGILATLGVLGYLKFVGTSKSAEARQTVGAISRAAQASFERQTAPSEVLAPGQLSKASSQSLCGSAIPVPANIPVGQKYLPKPKNDDFDTGDDATGWKCLRLQISDPIAYRYSYTNGSAPVSGQKASPGFEAAAEGDVDGDGIISQFALTGYIQDGALLRSTQIHVVNEAE